MSYSIARELRTPGFDSTDLCMAPVLLQFAEDPQAHYLWQRVMLDRAEGDGYYIVNKTRTAIQIIFPPGKQDRRLDMSYTSPRDENWKLFLDHCGGAEAVTARITPVSAGPLAADTSSY